MTDYRPPLEDLRFALRTFGMLEKLTLHERFAHADYDTVAAVLEEHGRFLPRYWLPPTPSATPRACDGAPRA